MSGVHDCVITYIDLIDITEQKYVVSESASSVMRKLHGLLRERGKSLVLHSHIYVWNDSVLLLCNINRLTAKLQSVLQEAEGVKILIEGLWPNYAIAVKGQTFPFSSQSVSLGKDPKIHVLHTSSFAMANCFLIEQHLKRHRMNWYIDSRIARCLHSLPQPDKKEKVNLLPKNPRNVYMYKGALWNKGIKRKDGVKSSNI